MAYAYGYSKLADKERSESQKGRSDFSSVISVGVVQTLENETLHVKDDQSDKRNGIFCFNYTINLMHIHISKR